MLQTRIAKRTAAAAVKIAVQMVNEGVITKREAVERIEPAQVDQLLRATVRPGRAQGRDRRSSTGLNASPGAAVGRAVFDADTAVEWVERGEPVILVRVETSPDDFHGMAVARGSSPPAAAPRRTRRSSPARSASRASPARADLLVDYAQQAGRAATSPGPSSRKATGSAWTARPARSTSARCRRSRRGSRTSPSSSRSSAGPTRSAGWASGPTPTSPRRPSRPAATAPRASASAAPSTCSARATAWRSSAAPSSSPTRRPAPRRRPPAASTLTADGAGGRVDLRRRDGQARGAPAGRLRGHLQGDGRPAGRHPPHRPAAPRVPPEPRGAAGQGHPGREHRRRVRGGQASCSRRSSRCTSRTRCSASAAAASG